MEREMLLHMIGLAVQRMDDPDSLADALREFGSRHLGYGVRPEFYPEARRALTAALDRFLEADATPELHHGWRNLFDGVISRMQGLQPGDRAPF